METEAHRIDRRRFYDERAPHRPRELRRFYHRLIQNHYRFLVPPDQRVLEVGCGLGDVLAAVAPKHGVGLDLSPASIDLARGRHPRFEFRVEDAAEFQSSESFDYILMADVANDLEDVQQVFARLRRATHAKSRLVLSFFNNWWRPILNLAESLGEKAPSPPQNWLSAHDVENMLELAGWEVVKKDWRILWPVNTPGLEWILNRWLAPLLRWFCLTTFVVARPKSNDNPRRDYSCSVIIPARNEAGNIAAAVRRVPDMGVWTELVFIEGHSRDNTWEEIQRVTAATPGRRIKVLKQQSHGKGGAVREAFAQASGELLFILDADLTVPPEQLSKFYEVARSGTADFVNGVRLVYPMQEEAMRFLNMIANGLFGMAFSWLLGQPMKDTLCGTKVLFRSDYENISKNRAYFGDFDPFGDFDLLFGAAKLNLKIMDLPVRYAARTYGETNIQRWRHGWLLLRMILFAARRLKFV